MTFNNLDYDFFGSPEEFVQYLQSRDPNECLGYPTGIDGPLSNYGYQRHHDDQEVWQVFVTTTQTRVLRGIESVSGYTYEHTPWVAWFIRLTDVEPRPIARGAKGWLTDEVTVREALAAMCQILGETDIAQ